MLWPNPEGRGGPVARAALRHVLAIALLFVAASVNASGSQRFPLVCGLKDAYISVSLGPSGRLTMVHRPLMGGLVEKYVLRTSQPTTTMYRFVFSRDCRWLFIGTTNGIVEIVRLGSEPPPSLPNGIGRFRNAMRCSPRSITAMATLAGDVRLVVGDADGWVSIWDTTTGRQLGKSIAAAAGPVRSLAANSGKAAAVVVVSDKGILSLPMEAFFQ